ncbi:MAG TPA: class I SAM-dependent methyltransferase [Pyrinomonadaceae bacterium]|nr:class I SAM-dependent methyltransferase [Pyrinomonadaceae bacterium]
MAQTVSTKTPLNEEKLQNFLGQVVGDFGAALSSVLGYIGIKLGLYNALGESEGLTSAELAAKTNTTERYVREWLLNQASGGYVEYDAASGKYSLAPEQKVALTDETSQFYVGGGFYVVKAMVNAQPRIMEAFQNGGGMLWGEHDSDLFVGTEKFFRPGYQAHLVAEWIPALTGIEEKLKTGGKIADVGCGHGASSILLAEAYPNSQIYGFDNHEPSVKHAQSAAAKAGVATRVKFEAASATDFPDAQYDLICFFDCLHDMGNPTAAIKHCFDTLKSDGSVLIVEPMAGNSVEENFNPVGRTFSAASTLCCTANAIAQGGTALGAVASEDALKETVLAGGFKHFRRAAETPFNRIFEARKQ